jgi:hypothetical protein
MKKSLLTVAAAAMAAVAAHADTTVYEYNFNNYPAGPVKYTLDTENKFRGYSEYVNDANPFDSKIGCIVAYTNGTGNRSGISVVNLGEAEGNVLCLNGNGSKLSDVLGIALPEMEAQNPWYNLNFILGSQSTSYVNKSVRVEFTYAVFHNEDATETSTYFDNFSLRAKGQGNLVGGVAYSGIDHQASKNAGKLEEWVKYTCDQTVTSGGAPYTFSVQIHNGGTINNRALLIKDIKFSVIDAVNEEYKAGKTESVAFGAVKAVAATAWTPTITDGVLAYPHAYCNESAEYAMKRVSGTTEADLLAAVKAANDSFVDEDFAPVADGDYFTQKSDGNWTVKEDAVVDYVNPVVATADDAETLEKVVLAVRVKAGANNVVVGESYYSYGKNSDGNTTTTGVTDVTIAGDDTAEYYNLSGVRVANPTTPGLYIRRQGTKATKVVIK